MMDKVFKKLDEAMDSLDDFIGTTFGKKTMGNDVVYTNNDGHVVITGPVKTVRVNNQQFELKKKDAKP